MATYEDMDYQKYMGKAETDKALFTLKGFCRELPWI